MVRACKGQFSVGNVAPRAPGQPFFGLLCHKPVGAFPNLGRNVLAHRPQCKLHTRSTPGLDACIEQATWSERHSVAEGD